MITSVSATELAKLGKCETLVKKSVSYSQGPFSRANTPKSSRGNENTLRGEFAHFRYEAAALRFMTSIEGAKRRVYQVVFAATVALGLLALLAANTSS